MSNASRLIDKLVKKNMVERKECPEDRRQMDVRISRHGLDLLDKIDQELERINRQMFNCDEKEAGNINALLDNVRK
jgi:DNA-binding MarR family transcriptional regulator